MNFKPNPKCNAPFLISGTHNVSGPGPKTIGLRIYEADGGHADVGLNLLISNSVNLEEAIPIANLLDDNNNDELRFSATCT